MKKSLFIAFVLAMAATTVFGQKGLYKASLTKVETQGKITADSTSIKIDSIGNVFNPHYLFTDKNIEVNWQYSLNDFDFELKNFSNQTIRLLWDEAAYIDKDGNTHKVFHKGVKFMDRENAQPATGIIKGAKLSDLIAPTDYVYYSEGSYGGWRQLNLFESPKKHTLPAFDGSQVRILLPIVISGVTTEYIFTFTVKWAEEINKKKKS
ncbi:hypothetical protein [Mucilaginibacter sp. SP1R1]|uniref:hypothetical protein n=1 Tax=Mucilaginibacter sp. SP1R1 TaxID=2723091 RepID=UPI001622544B|nr:hypothetical protein [Mucilaginibacter sp. SP1R1]MBB6152276.1 hypothetical protein [Mucilaginibacter sp. SP1R1]